jgi:hypothetical protein
MARWIVEQKVEKWVQTEIHADTLKEAITLSQQDGVVWENTDFEEYVDYYFVENMDTGESFRILDNITTKES